MVGAITEVCTKCHGNPEEGQTNRTWGSQGGGTLELGFKDKEAFAPLLRLCLPNFSLITLPQKY